MLLQHVHFQALSSENLLRLDRAALPGRNGDAMHPGVDEALTARKRNRSPSTFQSKRRRLQHWSPFLGAISERCWLCPMFLCVCDGIHVKCMRQTTWGAAVVSLLGSPVTLQAACDVLQAKVLLWRESMSWGLFVTCLSGPAGRCLCQICGIRSFFVFTMVLET